MKRELRLGQIQMAGEVTDAALAMLQGLDHLQADRFGQGAQQPLCLLQSQRRSYCPWCSSWLHRDDRHVTQNTRSINPS